jgi:hypothetical protein
MLRLHLSGSLSRILTPGLTLGVLLAIGSGCSPAAASYARKPNDASDPPKVLDTAVVLKREVDAKAVVGAGGVRLGDLTMTKSKNFDFFSSSTGGGDLAERAAVEAAKHGGTHVYLETFDTKHETLGQKDEAKARFAVYRVEPDAWSKLDQAYRPARSGK